VPLLAEEMLTFEVRAIDRADNIDQSPAIHDIGEIRMVVEKNRMRLIITQKGMDSLKWQPGPAADTSG
jgi:hypothetical protein